MKVIIIRGNGDTKPEENWYPYVKEKLEEKGIETINIDFPDPELARAEFWLPFIEKLGADENAILIGHSSGAVAAMRFAESHKILGSVLVGAYHSDLGNETEKASGYFDRPWDWEAIKNNQKWVIQFASTDDPYIPIEQARDIHNNLNTEYYEYTDQGHFGSDVNKTEFSELVEAIIKKISI